MLSLAIPVKMKRKTLKEKLHLCKREKIIKETFCGTYGEINIYRIYHFSAHSFFTSEKLSSFLKERVYDSDTEIPREYLKQAVILKLLNTLKENPRKTVFLNNQFSDTPFLGQLCRYSEKVYIMSDCSTKTLNEIYKKYGTLPQCTTIPVAADYCPDIKEPLKVILPEELQDICPKEFSPLLFAALLYKENNVMII